MSGGGMSRKRCAFPSMALLLECFSLFLGRVFSPPRVWLGRDAGQGGSPFEASAQGVRFHDGFSWFCLLAASDVRSSLAARRLHATEGIALFGAALFLLRRMNGCREVPCPGHEADSLWHPQERLGIHVCPAAKTVSPRLRRIPENGFSATLRTFCSFSEIVPKEICFF